jgi:hypothetical protein
VEWSGVAEREHAVARIDVEDLAELPGHMQGVGRIVNEYKNMKGIMSP